MYQVLNWMLTHKHKKARHDPCSSFIHLFIQSLSKHFKYLLCPGIGLAAADAALIKIDMDPHKAYFLVGKT